MSSAMGAIGEDAGGNFIVDTMQRYGINTSGPVRRSRPQLRCCRSRLNGATASLHVLGANAALIEDDIDFDAIAGAQHLHFGGVPDAGYLDGESTARILKHAGPRRGAGDA